MLHIHIWLFADFSSSSSHDIPDSGTPYIDMEPMMPLHHPSTPGGSTSGSQPVSTCGDGDEYIDMSPVSSQPGRTWLCCILGILRYL